MTDASWHDRIDDAQEHLDELIQAIDAFMATKPYAAVEEFDPDSGLFLVTARIPVAPPKRVAKLVGLFAYELRSCLDHLMFALATDPSIDDAPKGTEFPVFCDRPSFKRRKRNGDVAHGSGLYKMRGAHLPEHKRSSNNCSRSRRLHTTPTPTRSPSSTTSAL